MKWWLAPIAATAAAVTLWMVVPQERLQQVATAPTPEAAAPAEPAAGARARDEAAPPMAPASQPADGNQRFAEVKRQPAGAPRAAQQEKAPATQDRLGTKANVADSVAAKADDTAKDRRDKEERLARVEAEPARAPAAPPAAAAPAESAATIGNAITQLRKQAAPLVIVSPDPRYRWRATSDGIDFSVDGGRTWLPVRLPQGEVVTAGAAPAPLSCWLVGRRGLVLLARDGTDFTRIPFPETVDLASVSSPELRIAVVTTADGRTFRTENAGRTWRQQ